MQNEEGMGMCEMSKDAEGGEYVSASDRAISRSRPMSSESCRRVWSCSCSLLLTRGDDCAHELLIPGVCFN